MTILFVSLDEHEKLKTQLALAQGTASVRLRALEETIAENNRLSGQLAALHAAWEADETGRIDGALFEPAAAEAHNRRVRAEALESAAEEFALTLSVGPPSAIREAVCAWLCERARTERSR